jgi:hypothetical protein
LRTTAATEPPATRTHIRPPTGDGTMPPPTWTDPPWLPPTAAAADGVGLEVGVATGVCGTGVGGSASLAVGGGVDAGAGVAVGAAVGVGVAVGLGVGVGVGVSVGVGVGVGVGVAHVPV